MSKGQRAMAVAMVLAGAEYKNYTLGVSKQYVSFARTVLDSAPDLAGNRAGGERGRPAATAILHVSQT